MGCISKTVYTEVDVDIDFDEIVSDISESEKAELLAKLIGTTSIPFGLGDGDVPRIQNIIERAYAAIKQVPNVPREVADLFWLVHGRAI